jgi:transposase
MKLRMLKFRGHSITIIGAISMERGLIHFEIFDESNNSDHFGHFLIALKEKCQGRKVTIVQDNLRIHHSHAVQHIYNKVFTRTMLPTFSSELNPIERLWS